MSSIAELPVVGHREPVVGGVNDEHAAVLHTEGGSRGGRCGELLLIQSNADLIACLRAGSGCNKQRALSE